MCSSSSAPSPSYVIIIILVHSNGRRVCNCDRVIVHRNKVMTHLNPYMHQYQRTSFSSTTNTLLFHMFNQHQCGVVHITITVWLHSRWVCNCDGFMLHRIPCTKQLHIQNYLWTNTSCSIKAITASFHISNQIMTWCIVYQAMSRSNSNKHQYQLTSCSVEATTIPFHVIN